MLTLHTVCPPLWLMGSHTMCTRVKCVATLSPARACSLGACGWRLLLPRLKRRVPGLSEPLPPRDPSAGPGWAAPHSSAAMWGKLHVSPGVLPAVSTHLPGLRGDQGHVCCVLRGGLAAGSAPVGQAVRRPWALSPPNHRFLPD